MPEQGRVKVYTTKSAAQAIGVSTRTMTRLAQQIGKALQSGKFNLYSQSDVDRMIQIYRTAPDHSKSRAAFRRA